MPDATPPLVAVPTGTDGTVVRPGAGGGVATMTQVVLTWERVVVTLPTGQLDTVGAQEVIVYDLVL